MMKRMNLQLFAEPAGGAGGAEPPAGGQNQQTQTQTGQQASPAIDYAKIQQMLDGTLAAKQQKAAQQPDVGAIQQQLTQAQAVAQKAMIDSAATMTAVSLGIDAKTIPYVLKMADLSQVMGQDGKINDEALKAALNKVLEDVPALKPQASGSTGFIQVGAASGQQQTQATDDALKKAFGL